ncbi:MAG: hypothetical protein VR65_10735 [Desulfobulbaceae bacterium BRH_c16a]|nr:MAG: hypothetical protein VR65_10735 [Desulfobulbaceae bacterium BRH_c16a]
MSFAIPAVEQSGCIATTRNAGIATVLVARRNAMIPKPKRIIKPPVLAKTPTGTELMVLCDNGIWYFLRDLAQVVKVSPEAMRARFARMHWSNPEILAQNRFKAFRAKKQNSVPAPKKTTSLSALGDKTRKHNLDKLAGPGLLERSR